jgi:hypothetical protein
MIRVTSRILGFLAVFAVLSIMPGRHALAQTITLVTNTTDWRESTVFDTSNANDTPWPGASFLPDASTFTLTPTAGASHVSPVPGATTLVGDGSVRFFRATFILSEFADITADVRASFDNDLNIFINGRELALDGDFSFGNFGAPNHRLFVNTDGSIINGYEGGQPFTGRIATSFPASFFNTGENEVILALRNLNGDGGGVGFRADFTARPVPAPSALLTALIGFVPGVAFLFRRRKAVC